METSISFLFLTLVFGTCYSIVHFKEDANPGQSIKNYSCSGNAAITTVGINKTFFNLTKLNSNTFELNLNRKVDLENPSDFSIYTDGCLNKTNTTGMKLTFTCNNTNPVTEEIVIEQKRDSNPYFCFTNCSKIESLTFNEKENTTNGTTLLEFRICDKHGNAEHSSVDMKIYPGTVLTEQNKKEIKLKANLDYESGNRTFESYAILNNNTATRLNITLNVEDSDDLGIAFDQTSFRCDIPEDHPATVTGCSVTASDMDKGINDQISYKLLSVTPSDNNLSLLPNGSVLLKKNLDREKVSMYFLSIMGYQKNRPQDRMNFTTLLIRVNDTDDNAPEMVQAIYNVSLIENSPMGTIVCQVSAVDKDEGVNAQFEYQLSNNNSLFKVDNSTGTVKVKAAIDREKIPANPITFKIKAVSSKNKTMYSEANVTVFVLDENDNSPQFTNEPKTVTIDKTHSLTDKIFQASAKDADYGANGDIAYRLSTSSSIFTINQTNGIITLKASLNETVTFTYTLDVIATDQSKDVNKRRSSIMTLTVRVNDKNIHAPEFKDMQTNIEVSEDVEIGTTLLNIKTEDKDPTDNLTLSLADDFGVFILDGTSLKTKGMLDRDNAATSSYSVLITVNDSKHTTKAVLNITVTDVNDNSPVFDLKKYIFSITEEQDNITVGTVRVNSNTII